MLKGLLLFAAVASASAVSILYTCGRARIKYEEDLARINKQYSEDLQTLVNLLSSEAEFEKLSEEESEELAKINREIDKYDAYSTLS